MSRVLMRRILRSILRIGRSIRFFRRGDTNDGSSTREGTVAGDGGSFYAQSGSSVW